MEAIDPFPPSSRIDGTLYGDNEAHVFGIQAHRNKDLRYEIIDKAFGIELK